MIGPVLRAEECFQILHCVGTVLQRRTSSFTGNMKTVDMRAKCVLKRLEVVVNIMMHILSVLKVWFCRSAVKLTKSQCSNDTCIKHKNVCLCLKVFIFDLGVKRFVTKHLSVCNQKTFLVTDRK